MQHRRKIQPDTDHRTETEAKVDTAANERRASAEEERGSRRGESKETDCQGYPEQRQKDEKMNMTPKQKMVQEKKEMSGMTKEREIAGTQTTRT